jgi:hypothetical protein
MMLHSILGDALTLGSQAAAFKPLAQTTTGTFISTIAAATSVVTNSVATAASAVTSAVTSTVAAATPTGSILNQITSAPATPIAAPATTGTGGSFGLHNPLDWGWLITYPDVPMGLFAWLFFVICLAVFVASLYLLVIARNRLRDTHSLNYRVVNKYAPWFLGISAVGLFFVLLRLPLWPGPSGNGPFEFGGQRIWFYLVFLTLIGLAVWFFRYYPVRYRADLADWQKRAVRRQYDPATVRRAGATTTPGGSPTGVKRRPRR